MSATDNKLMAERLTQFLIDCEGNNGLSDELVEALSAAIDALTKSNPT